MDHNHESNATKVEVLKSMSTMKNDAKNHCEKYSRLFAKNVFEIIT